MSLKDAKNALEENKKEAETIENLINPPKNKPKIKIPPQKDIRLIETILDDKLRIKEKKLTEDFVDSINRKYEKEIKELHQKAINLKREFETFAKKIEAENGNNIVSVLSDSGYNYSGNYVKHLPENMKEATDDKFFQASDEPKQIKEMKQEIDEFILNVKIGVQPLSDIKPLIDKINLI